MVLTDAARLVRTLADRRARAQDMTRAQWLILFRLRGAPGMNQRELAILLEVEPISVGRLVDRLEARGAAAEAAVHLLQRHQVGIQLGDDGNGAGRVIAAIRADALVHVPRRDGEVGAARGRRRGLAWRHAEQAELRSRGAAA